MKNRIFITHDAQETRALAARLARCLKPDDCLALSGDFGSGKTTFVQGLAQGLGFKKRSLVSSPSFVIMKIYPGRVPLYHFDLYRLGDEREFEDVGFREFMACGGVCAIEWADKIEGLLPPERLDIDFRVVGPEKRRLRMTARGPALKKRIARLK
jgi:tRNA threonylcarbamoyladenosine biosynthesis protein TsaE